MFFTLKDIREKSLELGWDDVGITQAVIPKEDIEAYFEWLKDNYQGDLHYMENQLRCHPTDLFPNAKNAIIFASYYKQEKIDFSEEYGVIASYARGRDYHHVHRKRIKKFIQWMEQVTGLKEIAKGFSDSTPVLEKALAVQAGLGWFGKNTLLIHRKYGTFLLLAGIFTSLDLPRTTTLTQLRIPRCGVCTRCIDACPTQAIVQPYKLDARKCLSYHLIESKKSIPEEIRLKNPGYIFGCDICQDVCPHNQRKPLSLLPDFKPAKGIGEIIDRDKLENFEKNPELLYGTPLNRRGIQGLKHTFDTIKKDQVDRPDLTL